MSQRGIIVKKILYFTVIIISLLCIIGRLIVLNTENTENFPEWLEMGEDSKHESHLDENDDGVVCYSAVVTTSLNVRKEPSADAERINTFKKDTEITVIGEVLENGWCAVEGIGRDGEKVNGYCNSEYLNIGEAKTELDNNIPPQTDHNSDVLDKENNIVSLEKREAVLFVIDDETYYKSKSGLAYVSTYEDMNGILKFVIFSTEKDAVHVHKSGYSSSVMQDIDRVVVDNEKYYCWEFNVESASSIEPAYNCESNTFTNAIKETVNVINGKDPLENFGFFEKSILFINSEEEVCLSIIGVGLIAIVLIHYAIRLCIYFSGGGSYSGSSYSGSSYGSSSGHVWNEDDDMELAKKISKNINNPNYDPEGFSTEDPEGFSTQDPESFPSSDDIW